MIQRPCAFAAAFAAMFCRNCGSWLRNDYKYFPGFGKTSLKFSTEGSSEGSRCASASSLNTFKEFKAKKATERGKFVDKKNKKRKMADETVGIAGSAKGTLKPVRGKSLPLKICKSASAETVREEALKKRAAYDRSFRSERCGPVLPLGNDDYHNVSDLTL